MLCRERECKRTNVMDQCTIAVWRELDFLSPRCVAGASLAVMVISVPAACLCSCHFTVELAGACLPRARERERERVKERERGIDER